MNWRQPKIFYKLLFTSSITIILTVTTLIVLISNYYSHVIIQSEMTVKGRTLQQVVNYFTYKQSDVNALMRNLYGEGGMLDDITYALHSGYEEYLRYRLDKFANDPLMTPRNIDSYFYGYFGQDSDIDAIQMKSIQDPSIEYWFIYHFGRWNQYLNNQESNVMITKTIPINNPATLEQMGDLTIYYSTEGLNKILSEEGNGSYYLVDHQGNILYSTGSPVPRRLLETLPPLTNVQEVKFEGEKYFVKGANIVGGLEIISITPQSELYKLIFIRGTMWILIILTILVAIGLTYTSMRKYSARIRNIDIVMREVQKGNLDVRIPESKKDDEIGRMESSFNRMLDDLTLFIQQSFVLSIQQQQAELKALQAQIHPHFLFNTLESIRMSAVIEGAKTSSQMIYHLSKLLRYTLNKEDMVPLYLEVEHVEQYLKLMQLKHPDSLSFHIDLAEEITNEPVQKLILQPIVENYIVHGFRKDGSDNYIEITGDVIENRLVLEIRDNGIGIPEQRLEKILEHINEEEGDTMSSIGLKNVHQRLKLKYGEEYGLHIQSRENEGTIVTITMPIGAIHNV